LNISAAEQQCQGPTGKNGRELLGHVPRHAAAAAIAAALLLLLLLQLPIRDLALLLAGL
jgi:hypothetical protein